MSRSLKQRILRDYVKAVSEILYHLEKAKRCINRLNDFMNLKHLICHNLILSGTCSIRRSIQNNIKIKNMRW